MRITAAFAVTATALVASPALAGEMTVNVTIPRLKVAEYHSPYTAIWIENAAGKAVTTLDVRYELDNAKGEGKKWLADLRTWWRRAGRSLDVPAAGVTGPTQPPGSFNRSFREGTRPLPKLAPGQYKLMVEAAREVGGRETVAIPFSWPPAKPATLRASGSAELGAVTLSVKP